MGQRKRGKVPVEGIKVTDDGEQTITTDFGDGTCDTLVEITKDGEVESVDLKTLKRGDRFKNILKKKTQRLEYRAFPEAIIKVFRNCKVKH